MTKTTKIALVYDFDGTLARGNMQENSFLPSIHMDKNTFWNEVNDITEKQKLDNVSVYMDLMLKKASEDNQRISKADLKKHGKKIQFYDGVLEWFDIIDAYAQDKNVNIEHYIISAGNKEILDGLSIAKHFKRIYGCKFIFNDSGIATGCGLAINYTTKTQFLFRINKGILDENDKSINKFIPQDDRPIPFRNMIFIGDGETDIPSFRLVKEQGGHAIAVYEKNHRSTKTKPAPKKIAEELQSDKRVNFIAPTDYTQGKALHTQVTAIIDKIHADNAIQGLNLIK